MLHLDKMLAILGRNEVEFIIIGGVAATLHGSSRLTGDLDIAYHREPENIRRLVEALKPYHPYPRGAPPGLPFRWSEPSVLHGVNFPLTTDLGPLDLCGEIPGGRTYEELLPDTLVITVFGTDCRCLTLERLIQVKRAAGRPRDYEVIAELELIREKRRET